MGFLQNACKPKGLGGKIILAKMNRGHARLAQWAFSHINAEAEANVLDVGCGGGANIATWLKKCDKGHVTGIDYSEVSVGKSRKLNSAAIEQNLCRVVSGSVDKMPFENDTYDYVSAFETVYFWPGLKTSFAEVFRVLKKGGVFLICNAANGTNPDDERWLKSIKGMKIYTAGQLKSVLEEAGFSDIKIDENDNHWICVVAKK